ncbi:MAG: hypothetical protein IJS50_04040, partial [Desulfovibrio sp.]|nr:hypothetical protein [Desulfovibrio sp.]
MKKIWAVLLLAFSLVIFAEPSLSKIASAQASSTDRFGQADLDSDDQLSPDEFGKAFDEIQPSAFGVL